MLHVRQAIVEDNDDLMPVLQQYAPGQGQLASQYGICMYMYIYICMCV